jgi:hypothetical protein
MALPILSWSENPFTKQPIHLRLESPVINSFWLGNFTYELSIRQGTLTPLADAFWRSYTNFYVVKLIILGGSHIKKVKSQKSKVKSQEKEGRRKKEEVRRKKEEGRRKK